MTFLFRGITMLALSATLLHAPTQAQPQNADNTPEQTHDADDAASDSPDAQARAQINALLSDAAHGNHAMSLGLIADVADRSVDAGVPLYNQGDPAGCYHFYRTTAQAVLDTFPNPANADALARPALIELSQAIQRADDTRDADRQAWAMRYAFDRVQIAWLVQTQTVLAYITLGEQYFKRAQYEEAARSFAAGTRLLDTLAQPDPRDINLGLRIAPLAWGHSLFALHRFDDSANSILHGLTYVPDWPDAGIDRAAFHTDPRDYHRALAALDAELEKHPDNANLHFLRGYEHHMAGHADQAYTRFGQALRLDPDHPGAALFIKNLKPSPGPPPAPRPAI